MASSSAACDTLEWVNQCFGTSHAKLEAIPGKCAAIMLNAVFGGDACPLNNVWADERAPTAAVNNWLQVQQMLTAVQCPRNKIPDPVKMATSQHFIESLTLWRWLHEEAERRGVPPNFDFTTAVASEMPTVAGTASSHFPHVPPGAAAAMRQQQHLVASGDATQADEPLPPVVDPRIDEKAAAARAAVATVHRLLEQKENLDAAVHGEKMPEVLTALATRVQRLEALRRRALKAVQQENRAALFDIVCEYLAGPHASPSGLAAGATAAACGSGPASRLPSSRNGSTSRPATPR